MQNAGMQSSADDAAEAAVLVGEVVIKRFPGNTQLVAQVGNADGWIGPQQKIVIKAVFNLLLTAVGGSGTGNLGLIHSFLHFWRRMYT
jgi:hypothetical protein